MLIARDWKSTLMNKLLIDTNVFIDHLRGYSKATEFLLQVFEAGNVIHISTLTEMELFAGRNISKEDTTEIVNLISKFEVIPVNSKISRKAGELLRLFKQNGLSPIDALIASSAISSESILVTKDLKHFSPVKGLLTLQPY